MWQAKFSVFPMKQSYNYIASGPAGNLTHRKPWVNHLTHLSDNVSVHGQKDSFFTHYWVILSVYWHTMAQMIHSCFFFLCICTFSPDRRNQADATKHLRHNLLSIYYSIKKGSQLTSKCNIHFDHKRVVVIYIKA